MSRDQKKSLETVEDTKTTPVRQTYRSPVLQKFGQLSRLTQGSNGNGEDANRTMTKMSDRSLKHNIIQVGTLPMGIGLYLFDYLPAFRDTSGHSRQLGVMADEVEKIMPEAVTFHASGYKMVNYKMLDIRPEDVAVAFIH